MRRVKVQKQSHNVSRATVCRQTSFKCLNETSVEGKTQSQSNAERIKAKQSEARQSKAKRSEAKQSKTQSKNKAKYKQGKNTSQVGCSSRAKL